MLAGDRVADPLARFDVHAREPELLAPRRLQVVPDPLAVVAEELVAGDLVLHRPPVHQPKLLAVGADRPDAVHLVPGALVAEEDAVRVGRRRLQVVEPLGRVVHLLRLAGLDVGDDHRHRLAEAVAGWGIRHEQARQLIHVLEALPLERATHPLGHVLLPIREEVHPAREREPAQGLGGLFQRRRHRPGNRPRHPHP